MNILFPNSKARVYLCGGAVRDILLGLEPKDRDYVVTGSTPEEMLALGFTQVGADFPVFLHPETGDEYALARTERKTGVGYSGFTAECNSTITVEEDLVRRDLTINSMALDPDTNELIDPYGGEHDLAQGLLRHTSDAFAEDPIRVLRVARFAARYGFKIADDTKVLMKQVVPELNHVSRERIWAEIAKGLTEKQPHKMMDALLDCNALTTNAMQCYLMYDERLLDSKLSFNGKAAALFINREMTDTEFNDNRIPSDVSKLVKSFQPNKESLISYFGLEADERVEMFTKLRAFSDIAMLEAVLEILVAKHGDSVSKVVKKVRADLATLKTVDTTALAAVTNPKDIKHVIFEARVAVLL